MIGHFSGGTAMNPCGVPPFVSEYLTDDDAVGVQAVGDRREGHRPERHAGTAGRVLAGEIQRDGLRLIRVLHERVTFRSEFTRLPVCPDELPAGIDVPDCGERRGFHRLGRE